MVLDARMSVKFEEVNFNQFNLNKCDLHSLNQTIKVNRCYNERLYAETSF